MPGEDVRPPPTMEPAVEVRRSVPQLRRADAGCIALLVAVPLLLLAPMIGAVAPPPPQHRCFAARPASGRVSYVDVRGGYVADDRERVPAAMPTAYDYRRRRAGGYGTTTSAVAQLSPPRPSRTTTAAR